MPLKKNGDGGNATDTERGLQMNAYSNTMQKKIGLGLFLVGVIPLILLGSVGYFKVKTHSFEYIQRFYSTQLYHISHSIETLLADTSYDINYLAGNALIRDKNDDDFTTFLKADEKTFIYRMGKTERAIVALLRGYQETHPYINSVYMGRENGSFVRSHPRPRPTQYDPRIRPWYRTAMANPDIAVQTQPYRSLTSEDINIGIAKALVDENHHIYGVIGADITLKNLCTFMTHTKIEQGGHLILLDERGRFLTHPDTKMLFKHYHDAGWDGFSELFARPEGYVRWADNQTPMYLFFRTINRKGWKLCALIPAEDIARSMNAVITLILFFTLLLIVLSLAGAVFFTRKITQPFNALVKGVRMLREGAPWNEKAAKIEIGSQDEIGELADTFNAICAELLQTYGELDESLRKIKEMDRVKDAFIAMVSHELRTPLTSIKGYATLLEGGVAGTMSEQQRSLLDVVRKNADRLGAIVSDLLDISKIESGTFTVNKKPGDILTAVNQVVRELSPAAEEKNVRIEIRRQETEIVANFDLARIIQTLGQVVRNAIQFSPRDACVDISVEKVENAPADMPPMIKCDKERKQWIMIIVADQGRGMPQGTEMRIFEKFYQAEEINTRNHQGLGIGLSIAKALIDAHQGVIWADSGKRTKGMEIKIMLPI